MAHKTYITFGQAHFHKIGHTIFDRNCVAVIESEGPREGRDKAFELFGPKFCFEYPEAHWDASQLKWFPRGLINVEN